MIDKEDELLMDSDDVKLTHVEAQRMIESAVHVFEKSVSERDIKDKIEAKVVNS